MGTISEFVQQRKTLVALIGGGVLGLLLGLVMGWVIWPVEWTNATPSHLRSDYRSDYLRWAAKQYAIDGDQDLARERLGVEFWEEGQLAQELDKVAGTYGGQEAIDLRALATVLELESPALAPSEEPASEGGGLWSSLIRVCGVGLLVLACVGGIIYLVGRVRSRQVPSPVSERLGISRERAPSPDAVWGAEGAPLVQFVTTYVAGDDHYDPSFSIELENGEFMGECGVGISETLGVSAPSKVTAFEVWLFDKSDIRTVTKVLMSDYAFNDEALRAKLAPKGEPVLANLSEDVTLETKTLRVEARVAEIEYGAGDMPPNSFFGKLTVDLAVWVLPEQATITSAAGLGMPAGASVM